MVQAAAILLLFASLNLIIDPYGIWGWCRVIGFTMSSPKTEQTEYIMKPIELARVQPETLFLGTSQVMYAMDMDEYHRLTGRTAYNFGLRGETLYESRRYLEHALTVDPKLERVYLGLSYERFVDGDYFYTLHAREWFLENEAQLGHRWVVPSIIAKTVLSWQSLRDSKDKIVDNWRFRWTHPRFALGRPCDDNLLEFNQREHRHFDHSLKLLQREGVFKNARLNGDAMQELKNIQEICYKHDLQLTVFILPVHARRMEMISASWDNYADWLREVVRISPVLDFTAYNEITMSEARGGQVSEHTNPYFWDVLHAKASLGNMLLPDLLGDTPLRMGQLITSENVDQHVAALRQGMLAWESVHPESMEEVRYYASFSAIMPLALRNKLWTKGRSVIRLSQAQADRLLQMVRKQSDVLDLSGLRLTAFGQRSQAYAVLENEAGERWYAMAEPVFDMSAAGIMHTHAYDECGFRVLEHLWEMPVGTYTVYLLEVADDGQVCQSEELAELIVEPAAENAELSAM